MVRCWEHDNLQKKYKASHSKENITLKRHRQEYIFFISALYLSASINWSLWFLVTVNLYISLNLHLYPWPLIPSPVSFFSLSTGQLLGHFLSLWIYYHPFLVWSLPTILITTYPWGCLLFVNSLALSSWREKRINYVSVICPNAIAWNMGSNSLCSLPCLKDKPSLILKWPINITT